ncbi:MAG: universal stress protein [Prosthecobacter sp.]|nr:universal stress protein [Prosthecobacter sp.]
MSILCATDFSKSAQAAANVAALLAKKLNLPLRLVHCAKDCVVMGDLPVMEPDDRLLIEELEAEADRLRAASVVVVEELRHGVAEYDLVSAAKEQATELIVLGSVGKGVAERWLVGSVTQAVAENAPVPTLVVRDTTKLLSWLGEGVALDLLCGVDLAGSSDAAVAWVKKLAGIGRVQACAVYVEPMDEAHLSAEEQVNRQRDVWEKAHAILGDLPLTVQVLEAPGQITQEFLKLAGEQSPALIVIGTHQRHGLQRLKSASFSRRVLAHATTNVLCVPAAKPTLEGVPSIRRVLLAANFTEVCTEALRHAHSLLPAGGAIHLVHVCHEPSGGINPVIASEVYFDHSIATAKARGEAEVKLKALPASLPLVPGVAITSEVLTHHDIAAAICEAAERRGADVICMGTQGHSRTGVALLGSTVQAVLARSHRPVFVVTPPLS